MTQPPTEHFRYLIKSPTGNPNDKTRLIIHSTAPTADARVKAVLDKFMNGVVYSPSKFPKSVVIYDDRPAAIR